MTRRAHPVPRLDPDIARLAGALADRSRIAMLDALLDGSAQPIGALARRAGISAATASGHLRRLIDHQLVVVDRDGPHRRVRLAGPAVAELLESIAAHAQANPAGSPGAAGHPPRTAAAATAARELRFARTCYDHLAGVVGVGVTRALLARRWLRTAGDGFITAPGLLGWLADHGRALADDPRSRRPLVRACLDWSERTPHVAGRVGAAIADLALARQWVVRVRDSRALRLTARGRAALAAELGATL
jgi:DNA-binding transcriptional ArsR family regulator